MRERMLNWLSQVFAVTAFNLRTIPERKSGLQRGRGDRGGGRVLVGVLSIAEEGFKAAMKVSGPKDVAIVLRSSADNEMTSGLSREETRVIADAPGIARTENGPLTSAELFVIINLPKRSTGTDANVPFRGVGRAVMSVRGDLRIIEAVLLAGRNEIIAGAGAARSAMGLRLAVRFESGKMTGTSWGFSWEEAVPRNRRFGRTLQCCNRRIIAAIRFSRCM